MGVHSQLMEREVASLRPYARNARVHSKKQIKQIAASIDRFGFVNPVLVSDDGEIVAGHGRVEAAKLLGIKTVPTLALSHLSEAERRAYVLADNKLALNAGWDTEILAIELQGLIDLNFDVELTGFSLAEIDLTLDRAADADPDAGDAPEDTTPDIVGSPVTRRGDLWLLGRHKLVCGDAQEIDDFVSLMGNERADIVFTDPPYNVKIDGNVTGLGKVKHREFAFASGEMSEREFTTFLTITLSNVSAHMRDGAISYVCMDWRHMGEILVAGRLAFTEFKNLIVWNKSNAGMGAFYRSKHELIFVFKNGTAPHTNSFGLGGDGRYRTNVWDYAGISSIGANRAEELATRASRCNWFTPTQNSACTRSASARDVAGPISRVSCASPGSARGSLKRSQRVTSHGSSAARCSSGRTCRSTGRSKSGCSASPADRPTIKQKAVKPGSSGQRLRPFLCR